MKTVLTFLVLIGGVCCDTFAGGKVGIYGVRMVPDGNDAETFSNSGWGIGLHVVAPVPQLWNVLAGVAGLEYVNLLQETTVFSDNITGLRVEQQTDQYYFRLFIGVGSIYVR